MNYLSVENLTYHWGDSRLFDNITFGIEQGQKAALIARNGAGKTTLLKMLTGRMQPDAGRIVFNDAVRVGYLEQSPHFAQGKTVLQQVFDSPNEATAVIREYEKAIAGNQTGRLAALIEKMDALGAWDYEQRVKRVLTQLDISNFDADVSKLSGGQQKRVALAALLISEPEFVILDEPTNHLDLDTIEWLEDYLKRANITLLLVTHDRYFLDNVCTDIFELDDCQLYHYTGNYSFFLQKRQERQDIAKAETDKARNLLRREQEWMNRQPQARATKAQYRIDAFYSLKEKARAKAQGAGLDLNFETSRMGSKAVDVYGISKSFGGRTLIDDFSYKFAPKEKIGIVGHNGSGKTTLLNMLTGTLAPDSGRVDIGQTVVFGYYRQEGIVVDEGKKVIEVITDIAENIEAGGKCMTAAQFLRYFMFPNEMHYVQVNRLSGGEKKRLYLLTVLVRNPNFLILDEPTNDLDILTLNALEDYLQSFGGTLIVVSHDRFFVDKVAQHIFVLDGNGDVKDFPGNYSEYMAWRHAHDKAKAAAERTKTETAPRVHDRERKMTYKERKEYETLEVEIEKFTQRKQEIEARLSGVQLPPDELRAITEEYGTLGKKLDEMEMRWLELDELA